MHYKKIKIFVYMDNSFKEFDLSLWWCPTRNRKLSYTNTVAAHKEALNCFPCYLDWTLFLVKSLPCKKLIKTFVSGYNLVYWSKKIKREKEIHSDNILYVHTLKMITMICSNKLSVDLDACNNRRNKHWCLCKQHRIYQDLDHTQNCLIFSTMAGSCHF